MALYTEKETVLAEMNILQGILCNWVAIGLCTFIFLEFVRFSFLHPVRKEWPWRLVFSLFMWPMVWWIVLEERNKYLRRQRVEERWPTDEGIAERWTPPTADEWRRMIQPGSRGKEKVHDWKKEGF